MSGFCIKRDPYCRSVDRRVALGKLIQKSIMLPVYPLTLLQHAQWMAQQQYQKEMMQAMGLTGMHVVGGVLRKRAGKLTADDGDTSG